MALGVGGFLMIIMAKRQQNTLYHPHFDRSMLGMAYIPLDTVTSSHRRCGSKLSSQEAMVGGWELGAALLMHHMLQHMLQHMVIVIVMMTRAVVMRKTRRARTLPRTMATMTMLGVTRKGRTLLLLHSKNA